MITPSNGNTFGWQRDFHVTNSLQNLCKDYSQHFDEYIGIGIGGIAGDSRE